jgi:hypothetical protein
MTRHMPACQHDAAHARMSRAASTATTIDDIDRQEIDSPINMIGAKLKRLKQPNNQ